MDGTLDGFSYGATYNPGTRQLGSNLVEEARGKTRAGSLRSQADRAKARREQREDTITARCIRGRAGQVTTRIVARDTTMLSIFRFSSTLSHSAGMDGSVSQQK